MRWEAKIRIPFEEKGQISKKSDPKNIKDAWGKAKDAIHKNKDFNLMRPKDNYDKDNPFLF